MRALFLLLFLAIGSISFAQTDSATKELQSDLVFLKSEVNLVRSNLKKLENNLLLVSKYNMARNVSAGVSSGFVVMILSNQFTMAAERAFVVVAGASGAVALVFAVKAYLVLRNRQNEDYSY